MADNSINYYSTQKSLYFTDIKSFRQKSVMVIMERPWDKKPYCLLLQDRLFVISSQWGTRALSQTQKCPEGEKILFSQPRVRRQRKRIRILHSSICFWKEREQPNSCWLSAHYRSLMLITLPYMLSDLSHFNLPSNPVIEVIYPSLIL